MFHYFLLLLNKCYFSPSMQNTRPLPSKDLVSTIERWRHTGLYCFLSVKKSWLWHDSVTLWHIAVTWLWDPVANSAQNLTCVYIHVWRSRCQWPLSVSKACLDYLDYWNMASERLWVSLVVTCPFLYREQGFVSMEGHAGQKDLSFYSGLQLDSHGN